MCVENHSGTFLPRIGAAGRTKGEVGIGVRLGVRGYGGPEAVSTTPEKQRCPQNVVSFKYKVCLDLPMRAG